MKKIGCSLLTIALIFCASRATAQEELSPPLEVPVVYGSTYPCRMKYTPGWAFSTNCKCACTPPLGSSVTSALSAQVDNGVSAHLTLHHYDFQVGEAASRLSWRGRAKLCRLAEISLQSGLPIVLESSLGNPHLDTARRLAVSESLCEIDPGFTLDMVVVGMPVVRGLRGEEIDLVNQTMLQNTQNRGPSFGQSIGD